MLAPNYAQPSEQIGSCTDGMCSCPRAQAMRTKEFRVLKTVGIPVTESENQHVSRVFRLLSSFVFTKTAE